MSKKKKNGNKTDKDYKEARFIAWAGGATQQALLFWSLAEVVGERIDYLFKEEIDKNSDGIVWRRIFGGILYNDLKSVVESDEDLFFHDSGFQMCLRIPDSDDYFAYDDHGIFWIYSDDKSAQKQEHDNKLELWENPCREGLALDAPESLRHVIVRGIDEKRRIVDDDQDHGMLVGRLGKLSQKAQKT